jgi:hypothetical protein
MELHYIRDVSPLDQQRVMKIRTILDVVSCDSFERQRIQKNDSILRNAAWTCKSQVFS